MKRSPKKKEKKDSDHLNKDILCSIFLSVWYWWHCFAVWRFAYISLLWVSLTLIWQIAMGIWQYSLYNNASSICLIASVRILVVMCFSVLWCVKYMKTHDYDSILFSSKLVLPLEEMKTMIILLELASTVSKINCQLVISQHCHCCVLETMIWLGQRTHDLLDTQPSWVKPH